MRTALALLAAIVLSLPSSGASPPRPKITGISHVAFFTSKPDAAKEFWGRLFGLSTGRSPQVFIVGSQTIELESDADSAPSNRISHVAFATDNAEGMRQFLASRGISVPPSIHIESSGTNWFAMNDPEGHSIEFVEDKPPRAPDTPGAISRVLIHAGFVVRDRVLEDKFYRDLLGFRLYWHGGMKETQTDWVDMQVPDGTQWLEYMLQTLDAKPDARVLGILNHIALGVPDVNAAAKQLQERGWKATDRGHPQIGRDGKWQLNLYDPDGTRVELMEFTPVQKPCCSEYARPHPK
jgi:catechol 2,3-dioxygenase-like lactoylglutathione lyase family enzyme